MTVPHEDRIGLRSGDGCLRENRENLRSKAMNGKDLERTRHIFYDTDPDRGKSVRDPEECIRTWRVAKIDSSLGQGREIRAVRPRKASPRCIELGYRGMRQQRIRVQKPISFRTVPGIFSSNREFRHPSRRFPPSPDQGSSGLKIPPDSSHTKLFCGPELS